MLGSTPTKRVSLLPALALTASLASFSAKAAQVSYNFNDNAAPPGTAVNGVAAVAGGVVHLTDAGQAGVIGGFVVPDISNGKSVGNVTVSWKSRIGGGGGGGADGYSLNWGTDSAAAGVGEEGTGTGLSVSVDTFDNGCGDCADGIDTGLEIKWKGARVAYLHTTKAFLRKDQFVDAQVAVDNNACRATFTYDGQAISADLTGFAGQTGANFVFGGRTGGANDNQWIDDLTITTGLREIVSLDLIAAAGSSWAYNDATLSPGLTGTGWELPAYDTNSAPGWKTGMALFGNDAAGIYDGAGQPFIGQGLNGFLTPWDRSNGRVTFYARTKFNWSGPTEGVSLTTSNWVDDGNIIYLNGAEIGRLRVPAGPLTWDTLGSNPGTEGLVDVQTASAGALVQGENTVAVEVHQSGTGSSDVAFALALKAVAPLAPTILDCTQPHDLVVPATRNTNLNCVAIASPAPTFQWYLNGMAIDPGAHPSATSPTYQIINMSAADAGPYYCVVANVLGSATSRVAQVQYLLDTNPPVILAASGGPTFDKVSLTFDGLLDETTATDPFNYSIVDGGGNTLNVASAIRTADGANVLLSTDPQTPGTLYTVTVANVADFVGNVIQAPNDTTSFRAWVAGACAGVIFETYNVGGGTAIPALTNSALFPNSPDFRTVLPAVDIRTATVPGPGDPNNPTFYNTDARENYGGRMRGYFVAPESGPHTFFFSSDDNGELWLSTDARPSQKVLVARESAWSSTKEWTTSGGGSVLTAGGKRSAPIVLQAGHAYYIEALYKEGGGGDNCAVAVQLPSQASPPVNGGDALSGALIGGITPSEILGAVTVSQQPASQTVQANTVVTFTVGVNAPTIEGFALPVCYQWSRDGMDIPGATGSSYTFGPVSVASDNGAVFAAKVAVMGSSATSANAVLNVFEDTNAPVCVSATVSLTLSNVLIRFNEFMDTNSATDPFNYSVSGVSVDSAVLNSDGMSVTLALSPALTLDTTYQVTIQNVTDLAGNTISPNPCTLNFRTPTVSCGFVVFQAYRPESTADNNLDTTLLADPNFPSRPNEVLYMSAFDTRTVYPNDSHEGYGALMFGYFIPPTSGNWIFYLRSDDSSRLFLNPNGADAAGKTLIQEETGCCMPFSAHASPPQALTAGQQYYIEALLKEGTGGDFCQVAAKLDTDPRNPDTLSPISGANLAAPANPVGATVAITQQPVDATFVATSDTLANESFNAGDGGFTVETPVAFDGPWTYDAVSGSWHEDGQAPENQHPNTSFLTSPTFAITKSGVVTLRFVHKYSFEYDGTRWDGGQVRISVNGSPFAAIPAASFTQNGYGGNTVAANSASELHGQPAFTADSPGYAPGLSSGGFITSIASGSFNAGDTIRIQFMAASDTNTRGQVPNWQIDSVQLTQGGGAAQTVTFAATVYASRGPIFYQWYRDDGSGFVPIAGANGASYTFPPACSDNGARFRVAVYIPGATVTSGSATLTVTAPNTAPHFALTPPPAGAANSGPVSVPNVAHDIAPGSAVTSVAVPSIGLNFGADEPNGAGSALVASEKAGAVAQANWNNLNGANGSGSGVIADYSGTAASTLVSVTWSSPNTWSSTGRGEENNGFPAGSPDRKLMTGYLDTTDQAAGAATVTVSGLGPEFTAGGYDVLVYALGGVAGRGGAYTIGGVTKFGTSPANPAAHVEDPGVDASDTGTYVRFNNLTGSAFTLVADASVMPGSNFRAPIDGVQIVAHQAAQIPLATFCTTFDALPPGSTSTGTTPPIVDAGHLVVTRNGVGNEQNYWTLPLGALPTFPSIKASWKALLNGPGGADGFSVNIGQGIAVPNPAEDGSSSGLSLCVDTYNNGAADAGVEIRYNNARLGFLPVGPGADGAGSPAELGKNQFVDATVEVNASGRVTFNYDGYVVVGQIPNYAGITANTLIIGARTGGASEDVFIDDLCLAGFAAGGCGDESVQTVHFLVSNDRPAMFSAQPAIGPNGTLTYTPAPGACGTSTVTVVAMDNGGTALGGRDTSDPRTFLLSIVCAAGPPTISCPPNLVAECTGGLTPVTYTVTAVDSSGAPLPVTCVPPSGTGFRIGTSNVVCTATDSGGRSSSCTFIVRVVDTTPPTVRCPSNITAQATSPAGAVVTYTAAASDACGIASFDCTPPSGSTFPCGATTVTCRATDGAGNANSCSFTVTVNCGQTNHCPTAVAKASPNIQLSPNQTNTVVISDNNSNACVTLDGSMSSDPDAGDTLTYIWLADLDGDGVKEPIASGAIATNCFELGEHAVMLVVDDGRCARTASITVVVLSACEAVELLIDKVDNADLGRRNKRPLIASLKAACASFDRGNCVSGVNQLQAFQNKVRAQIGHDNPALADEINGLVQKLLDSIDCK